MSDTIMGTCSGCLQEFPTEELYDDPNNSGECYCVRCSTDRVYLEIADGELDDLDEEGW